MNEEAFKLILDFDRQETTERKELIKSRYLSDETSSLEFYSEVSEYMDSLDEDKS